jgi:SpoVK/Ycf46/Vps4 family AAA+-type ATPase
MHGGVHRCAVTSTVVLALWLYVMCREHAPSIIFMDEVDSIGSARTENSGGGGDSEVQRTMLELLNQLDGFEASNKIKVGACLMLSSSECGVCLMLGTPA